mmetsp:Transcript_52864/g.123704  ORF Transcript_52864/g.123704 Transcript_52864/m.123704 type:complete len:457 (-) Transcript_52864:146-1516(-)
MGGTKGTTIAAAPVAPGDLLAHHGYDELLKTRGQKRPRSNDRAVLARRCRKVSPCQQMRVDTSDRPPLHRLQTIVVNLERRPDRMKDVSTRLDQNCMGLPYTRFRATDGKMQSISTDEVSLSWHTACNVHYQRLRSIRKGWNDLDTYQECRLPMSPGERGCSSSHIRAWRYCVERSRRFGCENSPVLVLEDDAAPTVDFVPVLSKAMAALPSDAHILYLGYSQAADWRREITPELAEAEYVWTTVGYIIWPAGARILLSQLPVDAPVDNWMASLCARGKIKSYCVRPKIVRQAEGWNVNSDVAHSDEVSWDPSQQEPLLLVGEVNGWNVDTAKSSYRFEPVNSSASNNGEQESTLTFRVPEGNSGPMAFQLISLRKTWDFRLHPLAGSTELVCDEQDAVPVGILFGKEHAVAQGMNFLLNAPGRTITLRVTQTGEQFRVWFTEAEPSSPLECCGPL